MRELWSTSASGEHGKLDLTKTYWAQKISVIYFALQLQVTPLHAFSSLNDRLDSVIGS